MPIFHENKQLVTPGDLLAEGDYLAGSNTYRDGNKIYASHLGLVGFEEKRVSVVALNAFYVPAVDDLVIGKITEVNMNGWTVDINAPYSAGLQASDVVNKFKPQRDDLAKIFDVGDLVLAKIVSFDRGRDPLLTVRDPGLGKIARGQIIKVTPTKVPRMIGRKGSMINMLKNETGCQIIVCQNGLILVDSENPMNERLAMMAIHKIEEEAHTSGLTDRIMEMIKKEKEVMK